MEENTLKFYKYRNENFFVTVLERFVLFRKGMENFRTFLRKFQMQVLFKKENNNNLPPWMPELPREKI